MYKYLINITVFLLSYLMLSQDDPFLSFYKNQMSIINPAFAGIEHDYSLTFNSRNQWVSIENQYLYDDPTQLQLKEGVGHPLKAKDIRIAVKEVLGTEMIAEGVSF